jgi:Uma2 family endonuclease
MLITEKKKYTDADYMMLEEGAPFQLINYDLIMSPSPTPLHQSIAIRLGHIILTFLDNKDHNDYLGSDVDVKLDDGNVFRPDIVYISEARKKEILTDRIIGAPDMVIEILSPSNAYYDLRHKKNFYEKFGVKEHIIIDPLAENAELYSLKNGAYYIHQKAEKTDSLNSVLLPGLSFDLSRLFR